MTTTEQPVDLGAVEETQPVPPPSPAPALRSQPPSSGLLRPIAATTVMCVGAGFEIGGIFGSWPARSIGMLAAAAGAAGAFVVQRSTRRQLLLGLFPLATLVVALATLIPVPGGPASAVSLVRAALRAGSLLKPPVPFDPGWRVVIIMTVAPLSFGAAWLATVLNKPRLGVAVALPVIGLTAITQPPDAKLLAGAVPFVFMLISLSVLFGGDLRAANNLGRAFELRRAVKGLLIGVPLVAGLVALNRATFLFPAPVHTPVSTAQKPRLVSDTVDTVLFEVQTRARFTGPWRTGVLDVYEKNAFLLPPQDDSRLDLVESGTPLVGVPTRTPTAAVTLTLHDLGNTPILPDLAGVESITTTLRQLRHDSRTDVLRLTSGRLPVGVSYTLRVPPYATDAELRLTLPAAGPSVAEQLRAPPAPPSVIALLGKAPQTNAFDRMEYVEHALLGQVSAKGPGVPVDVGPPEVEDLLSGSRTGSPFQIVAAEALIARWAGVPSRIGFGYDGLNKERTGVLSVRPRNASQWLEVDFQDFGWLPLIANPKMAQQDLQNKPKRHAHILANQDIAVRIFVPYRVVSAQQLYQQVRHYLAVSAPVVLLTVLGYLGWPALARARRRARRRRWAVALGPPAQVAVEYAEMRDRAIDLNVGDLVSTPLEFLFTIANDDEHTELAWLTTRVLYGDLAGAVGAAEVQVAEELARSVQRRLLSAQPAQIRLLARVSRASLRTPYEPAMPNVSVLRLPRPMRALRRVSRRLRRSVTVPAFRWRFIR